MTAPERPSVRVLAPPAICIGRTGPQEVSIPTGVDTTDGPALRQVAELIYKMRARRGSE